MADIQAFIPATPCGACGRVGTGRAFCNICAGPLCSGCCITYEPSPGNERCICTACNEDIQKGESLPRTISASTPTLVPPSRAKCYRCGAAYNSDTQSIRCPHDPDAKPLGTNP